MSSQVPPRRSGRFRQQPWEQFASEYMWDDLTWNGDDDDLHDSLEEYPAEDEPYEHDLSGEEG